MKWTNYYMDRPSASPKLKDYKPSRFMLATKHYDKNKAYRAVRFIEIPKKMDKQLSIGAPMLTPSGFTRMGNLKVGDSCAE